MHRGSLPSAMFGTGGTALCAACMLAVALAGPARAETLTEALRQKALNEFYVYRSPKRAGKGGLAFRAPRLKRAERRRLGADRLEMG